MSTQTESRFNQLCVWPGTVLGEIPVQNLIDFFKDEFGVSIKFCEEVITQPDLDESGKVIEGTGGRHDLFFYIADEDIHKFAVPRLDYGIRWWEDVVKYNNHSHWYSKEILDKYPVRW